MKRYLLFVLILLSTLSSNAQVLGIKINPEADMLQGAPKPKFGMSCGLFYNQAIYKALGFSTGLEYTQIRAVNSYAVFSDQFQYYYSGSRNQRIHLIEVPVELTVMMNENKLARCLVYFNIGYAFGDVFEQQTIYSYSGVSYTESHVSLPSKKTMSNSFRLSLEARYDPNPRVNLAFGIQYKYVTLPESPALSSNDFNILGAYVKTGLNFLHKKS